MPDTSEEIFHDEAEGERAQGRENRPRAHPPSASSWKIEGSSEPSDTFGTSLSIDAQRALLDGNPGFGTLSGTPAAGLGQRTDVLQHKIHQISALSMRAAQLTSEQDKQRRVTQQLQAKIQNDNEVLGKLIRQSLEVKAAIEQHRRTIATNIKQLDDIKHEAVATSDALKGVIGDITELSHVD